MRVVLVGGEGPSGGAVMSGFASGDPVTGGRQMYFRRVGKCPHGHDLISIEGGEPEHLVPNNLVGTAEGRAIIACALIGEGDVS